MKDYNIDISSMPDNDLSSGEILIDCKVSHSNFR